MALAISTDEAVLLPLAKSYREQLKLAIKGVRLCAEYEDCCGNLIDLGANRFEYLRDLVNNRARKERFEFDVREARKNLKQIYEEADRKGIILEEGWFPRGKRFCRKIHDFFQEQPPPYNGFNSFGIPELIIFIVIIVFYFYI